MNTTEKSSNSSNEIEEDKLSRRDALEVAIAAHGDLLNSEDERDAKAGEPAPVEISARAKEEEAPAPFEPPAEYTKEEKEHFLSASRKDQEAALRLFESNKRIRGELHREREELKKEKEDTAWAKQLADEARTFYKSRGEEPPSAKDFLNSIQIVNALKSSESVATIREVLEAKGLPVPSGLVDSSIQPGEDFERRIEERVNKALQEKLKPVEDKLADEDRRRFVASSLQIWNSFEGIKNQAGTARYADAMGDSPQALELQSKIGSLVYGHHNQSPGFHAYIAAKVPEAANDPVKLLHEAYVWFGGKVDDSAPAPKNTNHLQNSNLAAISKPGRGSGSSSSQPTKTLSRREWIRQSLEQDRENR